MIFFGFILNNNNSAGRFLGEGGNMMCVSVQFSAERSLLLHHI